MTYLASRLFGTPLLIHRPKLDVILSVVGQRIGMTDVAGMPTMDMAVYQRPPVATAPEGIAVIPIHGSLVKRSLGIEAASGLTSYGEIAAMLDSALVDPQVNGILLDIDSPGGEASGNRYSRDVATIAAGQNLPLGTVLGLNASDGKHYVIDPAATDGTEDAIGVLANAVDATNADRSDAILIARHAIVAKTALVWPIALTSAQRAAYEQQLAERGVLVRESA